MFSAKFKLHAKQWQQVRLACYSQFGDVPAEMEGKGVYRWELSDSNVILLYRCALDSFYIAEFFSPESQNAAEVLANHFNLVYSC